MTSSGEDDDVTEEDPLGRYLSMPTSTIVEVTFEQRVCHILLAHSTSNCPEIPNINYARLLLIHDYLLWVKQLDLAFVLYLNKPNR